MRTEGEDSAAVHRISHGHLETFIRNQSRMARAECGKGSRFYLGVANGRMEAVFELMKYLNADAEEARVWWEE